MSKILMPTTRDIVDFRQLNEPRYPSDIAEWCHGEVCGLFGDVGAKVWIEIIDKGETVKCLYGDYILQLKDGTFCSCKADIFDQLEVTD